MKVFIGWSGERSQQLGQALHDWIPLVLHYVEPWLSDADIAAGDRWAQAVGKELETSNFGIISVTRENVASPWILFEAGSLSKSFEESHVIPVLLDLEFREISGPLAQFQAKKADVNGISEVVQSINKAAPEPVADSRAAELFDALWPKLQGLLQSIPEHPGGAKPIRPQHEILEELVAGVRSLDSRLREVEEIREASIRPARLGRSGRLNPRLLHEVATQISERPGDPIVLLISASLFKDDLPWLYELGVEAYRAAKSGTPEEMETCIRRYVECTELLLRGPLAEELGLDRLDLHVMVHELLPPFGGMTPQPEQAAHKARRRTPAAQE